MWLVKLLLGALFIVFLMQNNSAMVSVWPLPEDTFTVGVSIVYIIMFLLGFVCGRLAAWSSYAPVRAMLRKQKKENKLLSKEHEKLNVEREKLNKQVVSLQEENEKKTKNEESSLNKKIKGWFAVNNQDDKE